MTTSLKKKNKSLKSKIFHIYGLMTLCFGLVYSGACLLIAYSVEDDVIERFMFDEAQYLITQHQQNLPLTPRLSHFDFYPSFADVPSNLQSAMAQMSQDGELFSDNQHWHVLPMSLRSGTTSYLFLEASRYLVVQHFSDNLVMFIGLLFGVTLISALICTYVVTKKTVSPIVTLADAVAHNKPMATLSFAQSKLDDEVGVLARTFEQSFNQLNQALKREADFTRDLGHELRTPLAIIKNYLTLQENRQLTLTERKDMAWQVSQLHERMKILMALARAETVVNSAVHLRACIEQCLLSMNEYRDFSDFEIDIDVDYQLVIHSNQTLLTMLLTNLIENALNYSSQPQLKFFADDKGLTVSNPALTVPDNLMAKHVKHEQSKGIGQGLYLVARMADNLGWQYHSKINNNCFSIHFIF